MNPESLQHLLERFAAGALSIEEVTQALTALPYQELGHSTLDTHRELRQGIPETVFGEGKTAAQLIEIMQSLHGAHGRVLATRVDAAKAAAVCEALPGCRYATGSRLLVLGELPEPESEAYAVVACAGTSDLPVAEEAADTLAFLGNRVELTADVGVAGVHRLLGKLELLRGAKVVISVAGMEGALTSVIGGLVAVPVIGVPTSVGYGVAAGGETALRAMLTSCASGVAVVNIDNGFGAAVFAHTILHS